jgi:hypothetical protein
MKTPIILLMFLLVITSLLKSQIAFLRTYGCYDINKGYSVAMAYDQGYVVVGSACWVMFFDGYLIRTNNYGDTVFTKLLNSYPDFFDEVAYAVDNTADTGFIVTGRTCGESYRSDILLIKLDKNGETVWSKSIGDTKEEFGIYARQTTDGGYIISGGMSFPEGPFEYQAYLVKTNSDGDMLWSKYYGSMSDNLGYGVLQNPDGGYMLLADYKKPSGNCDIWLIKTDASGDSLWSKTIGNSIEDRGRSIEFTCDGGYIIGGYTCHYGGKDMFLVKTRPSGELEWCKYFGSYMPDEGYCAIPTTDKGYAIVGYTESYGAGNMDIYLVKTDDKGDTLWTRTYGGAQDDIGMSVRQTGDGGYVITGSTSSFGQNSEEVILIKTDSLGYLISTNIPEFNCHIGSSIFPNPVVTSAVIQFHLEFRRSVVLKVYDHRGNHIDTFNLGVQAAGEHLIPFEAGNLASGLYYYSITSGAKTLTGGKMMIIR